MEAEKRDPGNEVVSYMGWNRNGNYIKSNFLNMVPYSYCLEGGASQFVPKWELGWVQATQTDAWVDEHYMDCLSQRHEVILKSSI